MPASATPDSSVPTPQIAPVSASSTAKPDFAFFPKQVEFLTALMSGDYDLLGYGGAIQNGKTNACLGGVLILAKAFPGSRWAIVRKDLPSLRKTTLPSWATLVRAMCPAFVGEKFNQQTWTIQCSNGSEIVLFPASEAQDPTFQRLRGFQCNGAYFEEANEVSLGFLNMMRSRVGSWPTKPGQPVPPPVVWCSFNPTMQWPRNVFYDAARAGTLAPRTYYLNALPSDNPHLSQEYLRVLDGLPEAEKQVYVLGNWDALLGRYFGELSQDTHTVARSDYTDENGQLPSWWTYWGGFDWGYNHPASFVPLARDSDGVVHVLDGVSLYQQVPAQQRDSILKAAQAGGWLAALKEVYAGHDCWTKQAARGVSAPTIADTFSPEILLIRAMMDRVAGWQSLRGLMATTPPQLVFHDTPGAQAVLRQLIGLDRDVHNPEDAEKVDAVGGVGGDDLADAVRYGAATWLRGVTRPVPVEVDTGLRGEILLPPPDPDITRFLELGDDGSAWGAGGLGAGW